MKAHQLSVFAVYMLMVVGCQITPQSDLRGQASSPSLETLRHASREWDRLFNSGSAAKLVSLYAEDAISMPPNNPTVLGRRALLADFESFFASNVARHETMVDKILMEGDLAIEVARYRLIYRPRAGGREIVESGRHMETRRKIDGQWRIVLEIWNSDTPAPK